MYIYAKILVQFKMKHHYILTGRENNAFPLELKNWYPRSIKIQQKCVMC